VSRYVSEIFNLSDEEKKKIGCERIRLTVGEARGTALSDKNAPISQYIKTKEVVLFFKDLGPQVSWTTVFLVEYFGPILITLFLVFF
jgi:very-long-chain enoyl-CoA reductase